MTVRRSRLPALVNGILAAVAAGAIVVSVVTILGAGAFDPQPLAHRERPLLPDLVMAPISDVQPGYSEGRPLLRFAATLANAGAGDFLVAASRGSPFNERWVVRQRVQEAGGGFTERDVQAGMVFAGDEHDHWHVQGLEAHRLERVDTGEVVGDVLKQGFCPFDTDRYRPELPGAPPAAVHPENGCGGRFTMGLRAGISVGWGDEYPWNMLEQQIDLSGLPDGRYRIVEVADPYDWFEELDDTNNETWVVVDIVIEGSIPIVKVVERPVAS